MLRDVILSLSKGQHDSLDRWLQNKKICFARKKA